MLHTIKSAVLLLFCTMNVCLGATLDVSKDRAGRGTIKSLVVTTNDAVLIQATGSGMQAAVQFTAFGEYTASYRWRFRASGDAKVVIGTGNVLEDYHRTEKSPGKYNVEPGAKHHTKVNAGEISIEWSYKDTSSGWLYYAPSLAKVELLPGKEFESRP